MDKLQTDLKDFRYFSAEVDFANVKSISELSPGDLKIATTQQGVIRSNCMDSLDRTSVAQSVIARIVLHRQLTDMGLSAKAQTAEPLPPFEPFSSPELEQTFRNTWADNGDQLSLLYAGTRALKTDFTRTGKRTIMGALQDGRYSLQRYYINHFTDGYYQDAVELTSGTVTPSTTEIAERSFISPLLIFILTVSRELRQRIVLPGADSGT